MRKQVKMSLKKDLYDRFKKLAKKEQMPLSTYIRSLALNALENENQQVSDVSQEAVGNIEEHEIEKQKKIKNEMQENEIRKQVKEKQKQKLAQQKKAQKNVKELNVPDIVKLSDLLSEQNEEKFDSSSDYRHYKNSNSNSKIESKLNHQDEKKKRFCNHDKYALSDYKKKGENVTKGKVVNISISME